MNQEIHPIKKGIDDLNKKIISILNWLILAIVILLMVGIIWWSWDITSKIDDFKPIEIPKTKHTNTETADISTWKIYRNEEFGFEIRYPNNFTAWERTPKIVSSPIEISFHRQELTALSGDSLNIVISDRSEYKNYYIGNDPVHSLDDYANEIKKLNQDSRIREIIIGGQKSYEIVYGDGKNIEQIATEPDIFKGPREYIFFNNGFFYSIEYFSDDPEFIHIFDVMMTTFKFIE